MEYSVCEAKVCGYFTGSYTEIKLVGPDSDGYMTPYFHKLKNIGKTVFFSPREAALYARELTEKYERDRSWPGDPPMRRLWEKYLTGESYK